MNVIITNQLTKTADGSVIRATSDRATLLLETAC